MTAYAGIVAGVIVIAVVLIDVFQTLFNPRQHGATSQRVVNSIWRRTRLLRGSSERYATLAGQLLLTAVIVCWVVLITVGWALIYHQFLPWE